MKKFILIDVNNLGYAAMYQPELAKLHSNGFQTSAIHGAIISIFSIIKKYSDRTPVILWDNECLWRKEIYPDYKANRSSTELKQEIRESYFKQVPYIKKMLMYLGIPQLNVPDYEADDIVWALTAENDNDDFIIVSSDSDWYQAIKSNVSMYHQSKKKIITLETFLQDTIESGGFLKPKDYIICKSIQGDLQTDNIPGISGVGLKTALKFYEEYGSLEKIFELDPSKIKSKKLQSIVLGKEIVERNLKLIDWSYAPIVEKEQMNGYVQVFDIESFKAEALQLELIGLLKSGEFFKKSYYNPKYISDFDYLVD